MQPKTQLYIHRIYYVIYHWTPRLTIALTPLNSAYVVISHTPFPSESLTCVGGDPGYQYAQASHSKIRYQNGATFGVELCFVPSTFGGGGPPNRGSYPKHAAVSICARTALGSSSSSSSALFPCTNVVPTTDGRAVVLPFSLAKLPTTFNTTVLVNFSCPSLGLSGSLERRFVRVAPADASTSGSVVVIDHRHRSLRIDGELWIGRGFYWPNTQALTLEDERAWMFYLAQQGVNQLELGLNERSVENTTRILEMADSFGIKVMFSVVGTVDHIMNCTGRSVCNSEAEIAQAMEKLWVFVDAHR